MSKYFYQEAYVAVRKFIINTWHVIPHSLNYNDHEGRFELDASDYEHLVRREYEKLLRRYLPQALEEPRIDFELTHSAPAFTGDNIDDFIIYCVYTNIWEVEVTLFELYSDIQIEPRWYSSEDAELAEKIIRTSGRFYWLMNEALKLAIDANNIVSDNLSKVFKLAKEYIDTMSADLEQRTQELEEKLNRLSERIKGGM